MKRDMKSLEATLYDVLVVGAGIHGATVACECAKAGLKTALVEKGDFGHATSANSLKIMHGGLRYLQHLHIKRMRDSIWSRRKMLVHAPHLVHPLPCLIPNHGRGVHSNFLMRIALFINDVIGCDRNVGILAQNMLPRGSIISRDRLSELFPGIVNDATTGASIWYDALAVNSERLTLSFVLEAQKYGACVVNYVDAIECLHRKEGGFRVVLKDGLTGAAISICTRTLVNTCGPWGEKIFAESGFTFLPPTSWAKAVNIIVKKRLFPGYAVGLTGKTHFKDHDSVVPKKGRFYFFIPWRGYTMIGTTYKPYDQPPDCLRVNRDDVDEMVRRVNDIYPEAKLKRGDVTFAHAGLVPMSAESCSSESEVQLEKESLIIDLGGVESGMAGMYSINGVKYTTAPKVASDLKKQICDFLQVPAAHREEKGSVGCVSVSDVEKNRFSSSMDYLESRYGAEACKVLSYVKKNDTIVSENPVLRLGEVEYMVTEEMACKLSDIVFRRSELGTAECPLPPVLDGIASCMAEMLHWDVSRKEAEIQEVLAVFSSWQ